MKPPNGLAEIVATFGDPHKYTAVAWEAERIGRVILPESLAFENTSVTRITAHRLICAHLSDTLKKIHDAGLWRELRSYGGGYAYRTQRGSEKSSLHMWGLAWDFDAEHNALGTVGTMPPAIVEIFETAGFVWGGRFLKRRDPMHYQWATSY